MGDNDSPKGNRLGMTIALVLALLLTAGVIITAKVIQDNAARQPVSLSTPEMPADDDPACTELLDRLPDRLDGLVRADLADPAPQGAAVWRDVLDERVTLRCGAALPAQYTTMSETEDIDGVTWLRVTDGATGSELVTWYSVGRWPVVAVTFEGDHRSALEGITEAMGPDSESAAPAPEPNPLPLADLASPDDDAACTGVNTTLPDTIGDFTRIPAEKMPQGSEGLLAWESPDGQFVTARCGVSMPPGYEGTDQPLTQVGDIVWFNEPSMTTAVTGTYYAMGRERLVAVNLPMAQASGILPVFSTVISTNLPNTSPSEAKPAEQPGAPAPAPGR